MKVYVGYILGDYAQAVFMSKNEQEVFKALDNCPTNRPMWVSEYDLAENNLIELDCD